MRQNKDCKRRKFWVLAFIAMITVMLGFVPHSAVEAKEKNPPDAQQVLVKAGKKALDSGKYEEAYQKLEEAYRQKPDTDLLFEIGRACEGNADFDKAIEYYSEFSKSSGIKHELRAEAFSRIKMLQEIKTLPGLRQASDCVDINVASIEQLMKLDSINAKKAQAIASARPFKSVDDVLRVKGIGQKTLDKFKSRVCPIDANGPVVVLVPEQDLGMNNMGTPAPEISTAQELQPKLAGTRQDCIDINSASPAELDRLNGIGSKTAEDIVAMRPFKSVDDLERVKGIGAKKIEKFRAQICPITSVEGEAPNLPQKVAELPPHPVKDVPQAPVVDKKQLPKGIKKR